MIHRQHNITYQWHRHKQWIVMICGAAWVLLGFSIALTGCAAPSNTATNSSLPIAITPTLAATTTPNVPSATYSLSQTYATAMAAVNTTTMAITNTMTTTHPATVITNATSITNATKPLTGSEILFLRDGNMIALHVASRQERILAANVYEMIATPDGTMIAMVRGGTHATDRDIWVLPRYGTTQTMRQITNNNRVEQQLSWLPDGLHIVYASAPMTPPQLPTWLDWAAWCNNSDVRMVTVATGKETVFAPGCSPSVSPDGQRIAFVTPPTVTEPGMSDIPYATQHNTIRIINTKGEHGWAFATANEQTQQTLGRLVYAPTWTPDGAHIVYHRFIGYQLLVDINYTEIAGSFDGKGSLVTLGAGWLLPPRISPDGTQMVVVEYDPGNARGVQGYEVWRVQWLQLHTAGEVFAPEGTLPTVAQHLDTLPRATAACWSPDGTHVAVTLPIGWHAAIHTGDTPFEAITPSALWLWSRGAPPTEQLATTVDYNSPLLWLP